MISGEILEYTPDQINNIQETLERVTLGTQVQRISVGNDGIYTIGEFDAILSFNGSEDMPSVEAAARVVNSIRNMININQLSWEGDPKEIPTPSMVYDLQNKPVNEQPSILTLQLRTLLENVFERCGIKDRVILKPEYYKKNKIDVLNGTKVRFGKARISEFRYIDKNFKLIESSQFTYDMADINNGVVILPGGEISLGAKVDKTILALALVIAATKKIAIRREIVYKAAKQLRDSSVYFKQMFDRSGNVVKGIFNSRQKELISFAKEMYNAANLGNDMWPIDPSDM